MWDESAAAYLPFALNVLSFAASGLVADVVAFIVRAPDDADPDDHRRYPDRPMHASTGSLFERFGLPATIGG